MTRAYIVGIDGRWYAFAGDDNPNVNRVWSIGIDVYNDGNATGYSANWTARGVKFVASPCRTRHAAYQRARRWADKVGCEYGGQVYSIW